MGYWSDRAEELLEAQGLLFKMEPRKGEKRGRERRHSSASVDELTVYAKKAAAVASQIEKPGTPEWARMLAFGVGAQARRKEIPEKDMLRWLQRAYSDVWAKLGGLRPGADLKDISKWMKQAYNKPGRLGVKSAAKSTARPARSKPRVEPSAANIGMIASKAASKAFQRGERWGGAGNNTTYPARHYADLENLVGVLSAQKLAWFDKIYNYNMAVLTTGRERPQPRFPSWDR